MQRVSAKLNGCNEKDRRRHKKAVLASFVMTSLNNYEKSKQMSSIFMKVQN